MHFFKKVTIAIELGTNLHHILEPLKRLGFLNQCEIHLVSVSPIISYSTCLSGIPLVYPIATDRKEIEHSILAKLDQLSREVLPQHKEGRVLCRCLFDENPKKAFSDYANEQRSDLVILFAREKVGFFDTSFSHYVSSHTSSNILILKHKE